MRPEPPHRTRTIATSRLLSSSPATFSGYICLFTGEMLRGYLSEFKPLTVLHRARTAALLFFLFGFSYLILYRAIDTCQIRLPDYLVSSTDMFSSALSFNSLSDSDDTSLEAVLKAASMQDNTVILTTLNEAWADPNNSILDLFLTSFRLGYHTSRLLNHLVIITLDQKAFASCRRVHTHCFALTTEGVDFSQEAYFMTPDYLKMMWRRIDFLRSVLEMGYNFLFTDADVMWFRDPFPHFYPDADFQIACDHYSGNSTDVSSNIPNGGFNFVRSNIRSIDFYKYWYTSRELYPNMHDQDVLNKIKFDPILTDLNLNLRFLDTTYFGGFCEPSKDMEKVCTMHANCCVGLENKVHDLKIMLQDWKNFMALPSSMKSSSSPTWSPPKNCSLALRHHLGLSEDEAIS
ncbi:putative nucleotide-diphospho-sugar transferase [Helianthus anomalus]